MKRMLFALLFLPNILSAQTKEQPYESYDMEGCIKYAIRQMTDTDGVLKDMVKNHIGDNTKTIYIAKQSYLKNMPDTANGYKLVYTDIEENSKDIYKEQKEGTAAVFFLSEMIIKADTSDIWIFPVTIEKKGFKTVSNYATQTSTIHFIFNAAPPKFIFTGAEEHMLAAKKD